MNAIRFFIFLPFLLFILFGSLFLMFFSLTKVPRLEIVACDVGQGDAILVSYDNWNLLIDTGPNSAILSCLQANLFFLDKTIELLVLTHADSDHIGGLPTVLQNYRVSRILSNSTNKQTEAAEFLRVSIEKSKSSLIANTGDSFGLPGLRARVVWSEKSREAWFSPGEKMEDENDSSVGLFLTSGSFGFLSLGDLSCPYELAVNDAWLLNRVHFLKVSHHGAKTSTCSEFLDEMAPEVLFTSSGVENKYNHPDQTILSNSQEKGLRLLRTDLLGEIHFFPWSLGGKQNLIWWAKKQEKKKPS